MLSKILHVSLISVFFCVAEALDRAKFKTCKSSSFCRRFRGWKSLTRRPALQVEKIDPLVEEQGVDTSIIRLHVKSATEVSSNYGLLLKFFQHDSIVRVQVDDVSEDVPRKRYRIPDGDVVTNDFSVAAVQSDSDFLSVRYSGTVTLIEHKLGFRVFVHHSPLKVDLYNNAGTLVQVINSKNFFAFERYRDKSFEELCPRGTSMDMSCYDGVDRNGMWEESFGIFKDDKPYGPSAVGIDVDMVQAKAVFGLAQHTTGFNLPVFHQEQSSGNEGWENESHEEYRFFNSDVFEYEIDSKVSIYGSIPFLTAAHEDGSVSGFLWLNPSETFVGLTRRADSKRNIESTWVSETGIMDLFVFLGPDPKGLMKQYYAVTGKPTLPPLFALGHHQSKWGYASQEEVMDVNNEFDQYQVALDVLWLDIQHTNGNRYMSWGDHFSNPRKLTTALVQSGRQLVAIVDPHIKVDTEYHVYAGAHEDDLLVKQTDGSSYVGKCWPGQSVYLDVSRSRFREFWKSMLDFSVYRGSSPNLWIWNDMNEPSVFDGPEMSLPRTVRFGKNGEIEHREIHNLYGQYFHRGTFEGLLARENGWNRPFVLTRSFFAGSQKYGPVWTGDNQSKWSHLKASIPMLLSLAVCGMSFAGADIGGFFGHPEKELFIRWHQLGALAYPFYRSHAHLDSPRREPWKYDSETLEIVRSAVDLRYSLMPYWYTTAARNTLGGLPIIRPLWFDHIDDVETITNPIATEEQLMVGDSILVRGISEAGIHQTDVYLPGSGNSWYDFRDIHASSIQGGNMLKVSVTINSIPVFVKAGSILPRKDIKRGSTLLQRDDPFSLVVWPCNLNKASGYIYIDDEESTEFETAQDYAMLRADFSDGELLLTRIGGKRSLHETMLAKVSIAGSQNPTPTNVNNVGELREPVSFAFILGEPLDGEHISRKLRKSSFAKFYMPPEEAAEAGQALIGNMVSLTGLAIILGIIVLSLFFVALKAARKKGVPLMGYNGRLAVNPHID